MHPFLVNYTAAQARFIESLAQHMERSTSEVVTSIVITVREILDAEEKEMREQFIKVIKKEPRTPGATYRQDTLVLPQEELSFVKALAKETGTTHSSAVRHIVAFFVENVESPDEDDDSDGDDEDNGNTEDKS